MKPSFIPLSSYTFELIQSRGDVVPNLIHLPSSKPLVMEGYSMPPYDISEMFILCGYVAQMLRD